MNSSPDVVATSGTTGVPFTVIVPVTLPRGTSIFTPSTVLVRSLALLTPIIEGSEISSALVPAGTAVPFILKLP